MLDYVALALLIVIVALVVYGLAAVWAFPARWQRAGIIRTGMRSARRLG